MRLVDGPTPWSGRVEIYHDGEWGTICEHHFGILEAVVVCRHVEYLG